MLEEGQFWCLASLRSTIGRSVSVLPLQHSNRRTLVSVATRDSGSDLLLVLILVLVLVVVLVVVTMDNWEISVATLDSGPICSRPKSQGEDSGQARVGRLTGFGGFDVVGWVGS